ncbi:Wzz/FepE/Etk N-terminal domain-containing protein [Desulfogranum marinum]|uniref:Wzz/FepE/Etk N-terminal domain-containing protein n=1 Tax=Desulfogranum marinum TaxID=453220 RepID=UPI0029C8ACC0|nr:Wzz/FepE/Etk N-terminal domain-containing protein [Desulfogranum marinum]
MENEKLLSDEITWRDIFLVLWKRKILIIIVTVVVATLAWFLLSKMPNSYKVSAIIEPATGVNGRQIQKSVIIQQYISSGKYNRKIQEKLQFTVEETPQLRVFIPKKMTSIHISTQSKNPDVAFNFLRELLFCILQDIEEKLIPEKKIFQNKIFLAQTEVDFSASQIKFLEREILQATQLLDLVEKEKKKRLIELKSDAVATLLYINRIYMMQKHLTDLQSKLNREIISLKSSRIAVENAELQLTKIKDLEIVKQPVFPKKPFKPKGKNILAVAFLIGGLLGSLLAFLLEFIEEKKKGTSRKSMEYLS